MIYRVVSNDILIQFLCHAIKLLCQHVESNSGIPERKRVFILYCSRYIEMSIFCFIMLYYINLLYKNVFDLFLNFH